MGTKIIINGKEAEIPSGDSSDIYSTEETRIGTWIDGKPLYRKVLTGQIDLTSGRKDIANLSNLSISTFVSVKGFVRNGSDVLLLPYIDPVYTPNWSIGLYYAGVTKLLKINIQSHYTTPTERPYTISIEYTKTTDTATIDLSSTLSSRIGSELNNGIGTFDSVASATNID